MLVESRPEGFMSFTIFVIVQVLAAFVFAEFAGGLFHWWEDRYGNPDWPILGEMIVKPNIDHHKRPGAFCQQTWWNRNNTTFSAGFTAAVIFTAISYFCEVDLWWLAGGFFLLGFMNEIHSWAHQRCSWPIRSLQKLGILQSCQHHHIHHLRPYDKNYCVMTNYMNPVLKVLGVWDKLEMLVWLGLGVKPLPERSIY